MFSGFSEDTIKFFLDIRFNNNQVYFNNNKERYKQARNEFCLLIDNLANSILKIDGEIDTRPHKCLARIRRDARYYKNQDPYRDHMWFLFRRPSEERFGSPFFWFELTVEKASSGVGVWGTYKPYYDVLRRQIANDQSTIKRIIINNYSNGYLHHGLKYKKMKVPDYLDDSLIDIYKSKELYFSKDITPYSLVFSKNLVGYLENEYKQLSEYYHYSRHIIDIVNKENNQ